MIGSAVSYVKPGRQQKSSVRHMHTWVFSSFFIDNQKHVFVISFNRIVEIILDCYSSLFITKFR